MRLESASVLEELRTRLRPASVAQVGGFRPPEDPSTSWFLKGVSRAGEGLPTEGQTHVSTSSDQGRRASCYS